MSPRSAGSAPAAFARLRAELSQGGYDILHVFGNRALRNGLLAARGLPVRLVAYRGIVGNVSFSTRSPGCVFLNPRIDCIVCVADAVRTTSSTMRPAMLRLPAARLVTIHKGHSPDWYTEPPADLRAFGIPPDAFVVGCVANYRPRKGIERLVEAMADLPADVHLLLVGRMEARALDGTIAANPARAANPSNRLPGGRTVTCGGLRCRRAAFHQTGGAAPIGDRGHGLRYGAHRHRRRRQPGVAWVDGVSGLVVPPDDAGAIRRAVRRLYDDPALRERLGEAARERIRTCFRIEDTVERTVELYRRLVRE